MGKPYSDRRWWEAPRGINSACDECIRYYGYNKCEKYPEGIPREVLIQSFPGTTEYDEKYCDMKKLK